MEISSSEIILLVFRDLSTMDLGRTMSVCREWESIFSSTTSLWRKVELLDHFSYVKSVQILQVFSERSKTTMEVVKVLSSFYSPSKVREAISLLELNKATLRKLDIGINLYDLTKETRNSLSSFRCLPNLHHLNLTGKEVADVGKVSAGKLGLLAIKISEKTEWSREELCWFSELRYLSIKFQISQTDSQKVIFPRILRAFTEIAKACKSSLIELVYDEHLAGIPRRKPVGSSPEVRALDFVAVAPYQSSYNGFTCSNLEELTGTPQESK